MSTAIAWITVLHCTRGSASLNRSEPQIATKLPTPLKCAHRLAGPFGKEGKEGRLQTRESQSNKTE